MIGLFRTCGSSIITGTRLFTTISPSSKYLIPSWGANIQHYSSRTVRFELLLTGIQSQGYSTKRHRKEKPDSKPVMKDDKEAFFVVRKGDLVGVYKSLSDCQAQVGSSVITTSLDSDLNYFHILRGYMSIILAVIHKFFD